MRLVDVDKQLVRLDRLDLCCGDTIKAFLRTAPTVEAEPIRHGHWVNGFNSPLKCSSCGIVNRANEITLRTDFKFCPYCGAKMDEGREDGAN